MTLLNTFNTKKNITLNFVTLISEKRLLFCTRLLFLIPLFIVINACGGGSQLYNAIDDDAINAANVTNKGSYKALAEDRGREPVTFEVVENVAYMRGVMDSTIPHLVKNLVRNYPAVDSIVMTRVLGTIDFEATLEAGKAIREACLTTVVPYMGKIASGGVHFFLGGCTRIIEAGGKLGVHTWKHTIHDDEGNVEQSWLANEFSQTDPVHKMYLDYQNEMGIPDDLYWRAIDIPFEEIHYLTTDEIFMFNVSTEDKKSWGAKYRLVVDSDTRINWGSARFYVADNVAILHGKISSRTSIDLHNMLTDHPEVDTVEFGYVTGTVAPHIRDAISFGYNIRDFCLTTKIGKTSYITEEAVHAFIAGCDRQFEEGGSIAVSSWIDFSNQEVSTDSRSDFIHFKPLNYYDEMGIPRSFYFFQLSYADATPRHVTHRELIEFSVIL